MSEEVGFWGDAEDDYDYGGTKLHDAAEEGNLNLMGKLLKGLSDPAAPATEKPAEVVTNVEDGDDSAPDSDADEDVDDSAPDDDMDDSAPSDDGDFDLDTADVDINGRDRWRVTPLYAAMLGCQHDAMKMLLDSNANLALTIERSTPLHFACAMGGVEKNREFSSKAVGLLLSVGAPITTTDDLERSPVHIASMYGLLENVKLLLASPAAKDLDLLVGTDRNGWTPLHTAAAFRWSTVAEYLMSSEAGKKALSCADEYGRTPLHLAMEHGALGIAVAMVANGASTDTVDKRGRDPYAAGKEHGFVLEGLRNAGGQVPPAQRVQIRKPTMVVYHGDYCKHLTAKTIARGAPEPPPENVQRVKVLCNERNGLLRCSEFKDKVFFDESPPYANIVDVLRVHDYMYVNKINRMCREIPTPTTIASLDPDTAICSESYKVALRAAGAVTHAIDRVMKGDARNAFCVVRPPGHHAGPRGVVTCSNDPCGSHGFCLLNNVAIGAGYAKCAYRNQGIARVAILDFDVHHGNGTEACIENLVPSTLVDKHSIPGVGEMVTATPSYKPWLNEQDPDNIFFCSVHGFGKRDVGPGWFYPGSGATSARSVREQGENRIYNFGIRHQDDKDALSAEWRQVWRNEVFPKLEEFRPDLILISAGFDAHRRDELNHGHVQLEETDYEWFTKHVVRIANRHCNGRVVSVLEGGYRVHGHVVSPFGRAIAGHLRSLSFPGVASDSASLRAFEEEHERAREDERQKARAIAEEKEMEEYRRRVALAEARAQEMVADGADLHSSIPVKEAPPAIAEADTESDRPRKRRRTNVDYVALEAQLKAEREKGGK